MFEPIRLVTVHPALVHLPLGIAAFAALAACCAAARRSQRWGFATDVALCAAAASALVAAAFGFVSFFGLRWPGGLGPWPALHVGFGVTSVVLLSALAVWRAHQRRRWRALPTWGDAGATLGIGAVLAFTGWVGGEVLVFHSGMAVAAAGDGALAPALTARSSPASPDDVRAAMGDIRAAFAALETELDQAIVDGYGPSLWGRIDASAGRLQQLASWLTKQGGGDFQRFAAEVASKAAQAKSSAAAHNFSEVVGAAGAIQHACAACHVQTRWDQQP
ncbi:MAG TPA: DUF2231 domain-containing protein [Polyangiaceae bacterium]|nr:DUF2231 domain-containing protein [Polyangiaceae bacterium]